MNKLSKKLLYSFIFILFIGLLVICLKPKNEYIDPIDIPNVSGIFKNINDENGDKLNVIAITSHVNNDEDKKTLYKYIEQGIKIIGVCSYLSFPRHSDNKTDVWGMMYFFCDNWYILIILTIILILYFINYKK